MCLPAAALLDRRSARRTRPRREVADTIKYAESKFDPWYFQRWARVQKLGNATRKLILTSIAITVESNTGYGFVSQEDLAEYAECSTRTVSSHLNALEAAGLLSRRKRFSSKGRRLADGFLLVAEGITAWPDGAPIVPPVTTGSQAPPEESSSGKPAQSPPEAQASEQEQPNGTPPVEGKRADARDSLPDDFPDELRPHAIAVYRTLRQLAAEHNAGKVWPLAVGRSMLANPERPYVRAALDMAAWASGNSRRLRDVPATYRKWLERVDPIEGVEQLDEQGRPAGASGARPNMGGGRRGRMSVGQMLEALGDD